MNKLVIKIKNMIVDSGREYLQLGFLIICFILPKCLNLSEKIKILLGGQKPDFETIKYYCLMDLGDWIIGLLLALYVLFNFIRKINKETILNKGNVYHKHNYAWYWFCSKILGYDKCNLILVPIQMQFKLVLRDTFKEYPFIEDMFPSNSCHVDVMKKIADNQSKIFTLIIEDTYPINDNQIPKKYLNMNLIKITRVSDEIGKRVYCERFIDRIVKEIRILPEDSVVNIFASINPKNTYEIAKKGLFLAERGNISKVNVFQQNSSGERSFIEKPHVVLNTK